MNINLGIRKVTNGKKTTTVATAYVLTKLLTILFPKLNEYNEIINNASIVLLSSTLFDKLIRKKFYYKEVINFLKRK